MNSPTDLSVVIPAYNEEKSIGYLHGELLRVLQSLGLSYEIIFVDDGSKDQTYEKIKELNRKDPRVRGLSFSRNFGHQTALLAGLTHAGGDLVITMDADHQHPPDTIPLLIKKQREGFDIVNTRRIDAADTGFFKKLTSVFFYKLINSLSDVNIEAASADFRIMNRKSVNAFLQLPERDRFTRGLISWMGFRQTIIDYKCNPRLDGGKSRYTIRKMIRFAFDGITSFSSKPLRISFYSGLFVFFSGIVYAVYAIIGYFAHKTMAGWTSLIVTVLILGGIQLLSLGIIGEYIARIFNESKSRPVYFVKDATDDLVK